MRACPFGQCACQFIERAAKCRISILEYWRCIGAVLNCLCKCFNHMQGFISAPSVTRTDRYLVKARNVSLPDKRQKQRSRAERGPRSPTPKSNAVQFLKTAGRKTWNFIAVLQPPHGELRLPQGGVLPFLFKEHKHDQTLWNSCHQGNQGR